MPDPVVTTTVHEGVASVTLNRPDAMNAITVALARELEAALRDAAAGADVIVVRGAGDHFCVGGDYKELTRLQAQGPAAMRELFEAFGAATALIATLPVPVIAAVQGNAMAGGFELLQACDMAIVADDVRLADNHANFAMVPGGGGSQRLPRLIGRQRALAHILTGARIGAAEAVALGLALRAVPRAELDAAAGELAATLAAKDRTALARTKALVHEGLALPLDEGLALERRRVVEHLTSPDAMDAFTTKG
ncbi:enoyl-CoA hydratase/isomerase family protein [Conexibacter sp. W3-3-2]|uniref:Enoyl-CoA hydratase n=1 Tax=Paraconexibacter algicola TaxID=2133960 RepID=A0A2T4UGM4_9ACTN|nr:MULTISPECIES: enoyl-CoA hydratase/isomerase family protein [Solirubrobacterales]MTD44663.1 enoyl-CoA hydratase/isomerase family protein [Conexibacter sp. W3-3-2]PTL58403.1 enoyl-CoA hydratase [Paraconexibacter algicola]